MISKTIGYNGVHDIFRQTRMSVSNARPWADVSSTEVDQAVATFGEPMGFFMGQASTIGAFFRVQHFGVTVEESHF